MTIKLHLGCGRRYIPGFVHVDAQPSPHVDIVGLVEKLPMPDKSVDIIYASHVLEHFSRHEYRAVLNEWFRVLRSGGELRLAVPDFAACARLYVEGKLAGGIAEITGLICGGQHNAYDFHKMIFDQTSLTTVLLDMGFSRVVHWDWQAIEHAHIDDYSQAYLPHLEKVHGTLVSLNLSAYVA